MNGKSIETKKCSVCNEEATMEIEVILRKKQIFIPRCKRHINKGYKGIIREIKND